MSLFLLSQLLVGFAFAFTIGAFQFSDERLTRVSLVLATEALAVHFLLLEVHTAAFAAAIAGLRFFVTIFWRNNRLLYLFIGLVLISAVYSYNGVLTILSTVGTSFATFAAFQHSDKNFRRLLMCSSVLMLLHNLLAQSPAAVGFEVFFLLSNVSAYYRMYVRDVRKKVL